MNIYESCVFSKEPGELKQLASYLAEYILPGAMPLSPPLDSDPIHLALRQREMLIQFVLFSHELGEEGFEVLLDHVARLETKRNEQHDPTLQEIGICFVAPGFSQNFLSRIPFELVRVNLIEWSFIRSEGGEGILIRHLRKGISLESAASKITQGENAPKFPSAAASLSSPMTAQRMGLSSPSALRYAPQELSTPELVTFSRFGMELRSRKSLR